LQHEKREATRHRHGRPAHLVREIKSTRGEVRGTEGSIIQMTKKKKRREEEIKSTLRS